MEKSYNMPEQEDWKEGEWINNFNTVFVKEGHLYGNHLELKDFISSLLSSQAHALKEQMKEKVNKNKKWVSFNEYDSGYALFMEDLDEFIHE